MQAAVIVFPGSNCDRDVAVALAASMGRPPLMVWHGDTELPKVDLVVLPGGFFLWRLSALRRDGGALAGDARRGRSFQGGHGRARHLQRFPGLVETELLPGALMRNAGLRFVCRDVHLRVERSDSPFTRAYTAGAVVRMPVAHGEGNYFADAATLDRLDGEGQVAFRYVTPEGETSDNANPNGSARHIAGVFGKDRRVLGLMPHPERLADVALGGVDGRGMFDGLVEALA